MEVLEMSFLPKWAALAAALASIALVLGPESASANVTPEVAGSKLTVKGDGQNDAIALTVVAGKLAVNGTATTLSADANAEIVVEAGGGNDTVDASALANANYKSLVASGDEGNDKITGGATPGDVLNGDGGSDELTGGKGSDTANGGAGDDTTIWNNGDASDVNNGGAGNDTVVINGSPSAETGDVDTYKPENAADPNDPRVVFARANLVPFTVNFDAEHLVVNGLAGPDVMAPDPASPAGLATRTSLELNGGDGKDEITGGDGNDLIDGGNDGDKLAGFKGNDVVIGGEGDDLMVWNNGDGNDEDVGEGGVDTVESNGAATAESYTFQKSARAGWVRFDRAANGEGKGAFFIEFIESEKFVVNSLGGDDHLEAPGGGIGLAALTSITINAGEGEDTVIGGDGNDAINGDEGNDTLIGAKGNDTVSGSSGDDTMIWFNGDGSDSDEGGADRDTVISFGNPAAEAYKYGPRGAEGEVHLERLANAEGKGAFSIDLTAEELHVFGEGGDDTFEAAAPGLAGRTKLLVGGGEGNDTIKGGDGRDLLLGEQGNDTFVGGKGEDSIGGGEGDDVMVWNNGDGSDVNDGEAGKDEVVINGSPAAGDVFTYKPENAADNANVRVLFSRTNLVPFTVDFDAEKLTVNGLGGDDTVMPDATSPTGLATRTTLGLDGGEGNDTVVGGDGNDTIAGGAGSDAIDGQAGNDQLMARDKDNDLVRGGEGDDSAQTDELTVDSVNGVEHIDATQPPAADTVAQLPRLGKTTVARRGNSLRAMVPVSCPATEKGGCRTTLTLETAKPARVGGLRAVVVLGSKSVRLAPGARTNAAIRIVRGAGVLARRGKLPAKIRIVSSDAADNTATRTAAVTLRISRP
jgi:Ca2+-binding RTX toxin-like protein